ncbi:filament-like plant protein 3 [Tanacetum coccineum]
MDRRSWLWRRKSSEKSPGETESSAGSVSSHSERFSDDQVFLNQSYHSTEVASKTDLRESEHNDGAMTLSEALAKINAKEELVKQHIKVAEEAVSGWEKAEREVLALRQQVEVLNIKNSTLEDRVVHLDGALKECLRQLRQTREEKDQIAHDALEKKFSETESSVTSIDIEIYHKLETAEKENSDLKLELSSMAEELEIRLIEMELVKQTKSAEHSQLKEVEFKLAECENTLSTSREQLEYAESKLVEHEIEHKASRHLLKEAETKLVEREKELKASRDQLEEAKSMLADQDNELKASRDRIEEAESKLGEREKEFNASRDRLEEAERKLEEHENELKASRKQLKEAESVLAKTKRHLEMVESQYKALEAEREILLPKIGTLENDVQKERNLLKKAEAKCQQLKDEVSRLQHEVQVIKSANRPEELRFLRVKQDTELALAGSKFDECQKTIASISQQLKTLAMFDDFLLDTNDS